MTDADTTRRHRRRPPPAPAAGWGPKGKVREPRSRWRSSRSSRSASTSWCGPYKVFKENKDFSGEGVGGVHRPGDRRSLIGIVNWFLLPSEIGNIYAKDGHGEAGHAV